MLGRVTLLSVTAWLFVAFSLVLGPASASGVERLNPRDFECATGVDCCEVGRTDTRPYRYAMVCDPNLPSANHPIRVFGPKRASAVAGWMANAQVPGWEGEALPGYPYDAPPACDPRCDPGRMCCAIGRFPDHREEDVGQWAMWARAYDGTVSATLSLQDAGREIALENVSPEYCHAWWNENLAEEGLAETISDPTPRGAIPCGPGDLPRAEDGPYDAPGAERRSREECEHEVCPMCQATISLLGVRTADPACDSCLQENEAHILACMEEER